MPLLMGLLNMDSTCKISGARRAKALLVYCAWLLAAGLSQALAVNLTLGWDPSPDTQVTGYKVYFGLTGSAKQVVDVGNITSASLINLEGGKTYEIFVTAYDAMAAESDPSNAISYNTPPETTFTLGIAGFKDGFVQVTPRGYGPAGDQYALGAQVTLKATAEMGALFMGWSIDGLQYSSSQVVVTIAGDMVATPFFKSADGQVYSGPYVGGLSMSITKANGIGTVNIGGEVGAWILEKSNDLATWVEAASGLTSEKLPIGITSGSAYFRVRGR